MDHRSCISERRQHQPYVKAADISKDTLNESPCVPSRPQRNFGREQAQTSIRSGTFSSKTAEPDIHFSWCDFKTSEKQSRKVLLQVSGAERRSKHDRIASEFCIPSRAQDHDGGERKLQSCEYVEPIWKQTNRTHEKSVAFFFWEREQERRPFAVLSCVLESKGRHVCRRMCLGGRRRRQT